MKRLLIMIAATLGLAACGETFTAAEREVIHAGGQGIMRVLSIDNEADSLALREESRPMSESLLRTEEYALLRERMLQTVQNPEAEGVGIAAPQVGVRRAMIAVQRFDKEGEPFEFFLNPEIIELLGEKADGGEGCLSVPELYGNVSRWNISCCAIVTSSGWSTPNTSRASRPSSSSTRWITSRDVFL